jgi:hypothetical protein
MLNRIRILLAATLLAPGPHRQSIARLALPFGDRRPAIRFD